MTTRRTPWLLLAAWFIFLGLLAAGSLRNAVSSYQPRDGDIIFQVEHGGPSLWIQTATASPFNHVGIVIFEPEGPVVYEALGKVRQTPLNTYLNRASSVARRYRVMRLDNHGSGLGGDQLSGLRREARKLLGTKYDTSLRWDDREVNCSEYVWKVYARGAGTELVKPTPLREHPLASETMKHVAADSLRFKEMADLATKIEEIDLDQLYVSPADLSRSDLLDVAWTNMPFESRFHRPWFTGCAFLITLVFCVAVWRMHRRQVRNASSL